MHHLWTTIAQYGDKTLANHYAELLETKGFTCKVVPFGIAAFLAEDEDDASEAVDYALRVPEEQAESATQWLDAFAQTPLAEAPQKGDHWVLAGAVTTMSGILVSFGDIGSIEHPLALLPYAIALLGGTVFVRGLAINRADEKESLS